MLDTQAFGNILQSRGFDFYSGIPCTFLKSLINYAINSCLYIIAANEGDAVGTCAGAFVGGRRAVVIMQNSGLCNAISPLTSLNHTFRIPVLGFVSLRGEPGLNDEPQHELMGKITVQMLENMGIRWKYLSTKIAEAEIQVIQADQILKDNHSFFFIVRKATFNDAPIQRHLACYHPDRVIRGEFCDSQAPTRRDALSIITRHKDKATILLATTGKTGRELYEIEDSPHNLYMVGSMGILAPFALGLALARPRTRVIAIDGDGALLMRMGALATNGFYRPPNLLHILLDNQSYDSTGGQDTVSSNMDFVSLAAACGYPLSTRVNNLHQLDLAIIEWKKFGGLTFIYLRIAGSSEKDLSRPPIRPHEVKTRLMEFL